MSATATQGEAPHQAENGTPNGTPNRRRRLIIALVLLVFLAAGIAYGAWWLIAGRYHESTDDAYVGGNSVQVTSQVVGTVLAIRADDTDYVKSGQTLIELDKTDAKVALDQAEAQLAKTVRSVRNLESTSTGLDAGVTVRRAELAKAEQDLARRRAVEPTGAVSGEELEHARDAVVAARAALDAALRQAEAQRALVDRTSLKSHPDVQSAAARVRETYFGYARTSLPAPVSGYVARRSVQVGQRVSAGTPLMSVVPLDQVWVDANFKEGQLAHLRAGQPVKLTADAYGSSVEYHGRIAGFGAGTGSAFALLPAQNATGNWIKIVQRVPVRIALDAKELEQHPLQIGLSMQVEVDTHQREGERLRKAQSTAGYETRAFGPMDEEAEQRIAAIIEANSPPRTLAWTRKR